MALPQFTFPIRLRGVDGEKSEKHIRMRADIICHVMVIDPQSTQARFAPEHNSPIRQRSSGAVFVIVNCQVDLVVCASALRLLLEGFPKMEWVLPGVTVDVDDHGKVAPCPEGRMGVRYGGQM